MNSTYKFFLSICIFATVLISSCELYNPAEPIPGYIHIDKFNLNTTYSTEGSNSHKITDAWVYIDDQIVGCFELPATFPVIAEGVHKIKLIPGIKVNGIASNRGQYPYYTSYEQDVNFEAGKSITLSPTITYKSTTNFVYLNDFEAAGFTIDTTNYSDTTLQLLVSPDPNVYEGAKSAIGYTDATKTRFECATTSNFVLPHGGAPIFLEFNYKCNHEVVVSIIAYGTATLEQFEVIRLNPSANWNKIYVYLTPTVSATYSAVDYKLVWGMHDQSGSDSSVVLLDNIKLIK